MSYRNELPQLDGGLFLTDGGIETTLIFHQGLELPLFAAFDLLKYEEGTEALRRYYQPYLIRSSTGPRSVRAGLWSWCRPSPNAQLTAAKVLDQIFQGQVLLAGRHPSGQTTVAPTHSD
jgi:hypothetical protein